MRKVLWEDLKLADNQRFWAFLMDIAVNSCDLSKNYSPRYKVEKKAGKKMLVEEAMSTAHDGQEVSLPIMDRFINLLMSL